ncbi:MAG TPA: hypothetical protein PLH57_06335 [Oligoflexia bacterium]|mgnify:CR=1 FL=1|nr:hypothetical protein [Oligoflexia bacterium]
MSRLDDLKASLKQIIDRLRESDAYSQARARYDELDSQKKLYVKLGAAGAAMMLVVSTVLGGMVRVATLKSAIDEKEALIGYLNQSGDTLRRFKEKQSGAGAADMNAGLSSFLQGVIEEAGVNEEKVKVGSEVSADLDKAIQETKVEVTLSQINLRQVTKTLYDITSKGSVRGTAITALDIQAKDDFSGWLDATFTVSVYKAK